MRKIIEPLGQFLSIQAVIGDARIHFYFSEAGLVIVARFLVSSENKFKCSPGKAPSQKEHRYKH